VFLLHQVTDDLVVEIWHRFPLKTRENRDILDVLCVMSLGLLLLSFNSVQMPALCNVMDKRCPVYFDSLHEVLLLLRLQCQLDEELLEFFVAVVDAKLLKAEHKERYGGAVMVPITVLMDDLDHDRSSPHLFTWKTSNP